MQQLLTIAAGGAIGAMLRFLIASGMAKTFGKGFPYGTLTVNVLGSLLMGYLFVHFMEKQTFSADWRPAILVGFLGALTTFSSFSMETMTLIESGELLKAMLNVLFNVALCLIATSIGIGLGRQL